MLTKSGAKLLDFGVAKLKQEAEKPSDESPTAFGARPLTGEGTIVGTLHYMAPEQVEGRVADIDSRTDIFAFGAVVYEMTTGKRAFEGSSQASVIAKILDHDPPQPISPPSLDRLVRVCLAKDPYARWQTATDVCRELKWIEESGSKPEKHSPKPSRRVLPWVVAALASAAVGGVVWMWRPVATQPVSHLTISLPPGQRLTALDHPAIAISPDGKNLVYVAMDGSSTQQLYLRPLDSVEARPIAGTENAVSPFFSPDGHWIGFFADGKLRKVSVDGSPVATLAGAAVPGGASWSSRGTLAFQWAAARVLQQVSE
jgi:serine/threonine-protein kinase